MTIKHLVLAGGGPSLFQTLGILHGLEKESYWNIDDIISIYGTSSGSIVATAIALKIDWDMLLKYFVDRPWHEAFPITTTNLFDAYGKKGIFDREVIQKTFLPLFNTKDIPIDVTMSQFYEKTNIHLSFYTFELNQFETIEISRNSFPDIQLIDAIYMSCAIPIVFAPKCIDGKCYLDGGLFNNYPINYCLKEVKDTTEILGTRIVSQDQNETTEDKIIDNESSILDYMNSMLGNIVKHMNSLTSTTHIPNEIVCKCEKISFSYIQEALSSKDLRKRLLEEGYQLANQFCS